METVYVLTTQQLVDLFGNSESILDEVLKSGELRCFDYEPIDSPHRKQHLRQIASDDKGDTCDMRTYIIKGRDDLSAAVIKRNNGWYEGVEMTNTREIVNSSADIKRRRVLVIYRVAGESDRRPPIICSLWRHYLRMRKIYKVKLRDLARDDTYNRRIFGCMEKMFKIVANSLYGYLNYKRSIVYSPQVAGAVTLLSRKTFYETDWLCTRAFSSLMSLRSSLDSTVESDTSIHNDAKRDLCVLYPDKLVPGERVIYTDHIEESRETRERFIAIRERLTNLLSGASFAEIANNDSTVECEIIYRDTDGAIMFFAKRNTTDGSFRAIEDAEQLAYEKIIVRLVNETFQRYNYRSISLDLEDSNVAMCSIMGKKKYWKTLVLPDKFVTKGFEKNAQSFVKHVVFVLQKNIAKLLITANVGKCRVRISDFNVFFDGLFTTLHEYYSRHGASVFAFNLALNPRCVSGAEARFIQDTIERHNYNAGDRVPCVFVLSDVSPAETRFMLLLDFSSNRGHRLNYYKIVRRLAVYFVQLVEGFKRVDEKPDSDLYMNARTFDETLRRAYALWLRNSESRVKDRAQNLLFERDVSPETIRDIPYLQFV